MVATRPGSCGCRQSRCVLIVHPPRGDATPVVRLAAPQLTPATLVHELAHVLAGVGAGHGPVFRRAQVDLARFVFGDAEAGWLLDSYRAMGLRPGRRAWPDPPLHNRAVRGPARALTARSAPHGC